MNTKSDKKLIPFNRANDEHRGIILKAIKEFRGTKLTLPKLVEELKKAGLDAPFRNIINQDDEIGRAFNQRKAFLSKHVPKVSKSPKDYESLLKEKEKFEAYYLITLQLLHNRGVSNQEVMKLIHAAEEGKPWE